MQDQNRLKKLRIKRVTAVHERRDDGVNYSWDYDSLGNLIRDCQWPLSACTSNFYDSNRLKFVINTSGQQTYVDTVLYFYDSKNRLQKQTITAFRCSFDGECTLEESTSYTYKFRNTDTVIRLWQRHDNINRISREVPDTIYDTLIYNRQKLLISETEIKNGRKAYFRYNNRGELIEKKLTIKQWVHKSIFSYKDGRLIREDLCIYSEQDKCTSTVTWFYDYNDDGLIKTISWHEISLNYKYEYY